MPSLAMKSLTNTWRELLLTLEPHVRVTVLTLFNRYHAQVIFVMGSGQMIKENTSLQLWRPIRLNGERVQGDAGPERRGDDGDASRRQDARASQTIRRLSHPPTSPDSPDPFSPTEPQSSSRRSPAQNTIANGDGSLSPDMKTRTGGSSSNSSRASFFSSTSAASHTSRPVSIGGATNLADTGTLHCKPTEPLLLLFTQDCEKTYLLSIAAVTLDSRTETNYRRCQWMNSDECKIAALERRGGGGKPLGVFRLSGATSVTSDPSTAHCWNILPFSKPLQGWRASSSFPAYSSGAGGLWPKVVRVSIGFSQVDLLKELTGLPCNCAVTTEGQLMDCLAKWHRGRLGLVREWHRRRLEEWYRKRYQSHVDIVVEP